ncbi:putative RNA methyltransferase [Desulfuromonas versatilis]|uniref:RNA methyltransferase n=1 Tax=Desulfuromonas versatilis TaxID=2802975 RepID=A0ABN6DY73_9BACT|nr:23S rRNA (uracil(1939)-C(5))-methyltransferase RlmD [Desulfuromonas versatilis]BCR04822.1 putative RNA methyltransferase [Desulfuromonas versatilis]
MIEPIAIENLAYGGSGVGRHQGKAVFVPLSAPGDLVRCRVVREKKQYCEAEIVELLEPAGCRRAAPCPVFGECGGCQWQHLAYADQARWKQEIFADTLARRCGVSRERILPLVEAPDEWAYRSRVQFKCRMTRDGFVMGFYRRGSHFVIDVDSCPIAAAPINRALALFRQWLGASPCPERVPQVDLACGDDGRLRAEVHVLEGAQELLAGHLEPLAAAAGISLFIQAGRKSTLRHVRGSGELFIHPLAGEPMALAYGPGGFAQVNLAQNRALVGHVLGAAALGGSERVLDLFCGMGNFSLPLARHAASVVGVEDYAPSIAMARRNASANGLGNTRFLACPAESALAEQWQEGFDLVLLDPPRAGAYDICRELGRARPGKIIYISCDPQTLARDLAPLLHSGYSLNSSRAFDLFPQTYHVESVSVLTRTA